MIKKIVLMPFLALFMFTAQPVVADMHMKKMHGSSCQCDKKDNGSDCQCHYIKKLAKQLNLTDEQKEKIKTIKNKGMSQLKSDFEQMKQVRHDMKKLLKNEKLNHGKLDELIHKKKELLGSIMKLKYTMKHEIYQVLTPKQKEKFSNMMDQWKEKKMHEDDDE